MKKSKTLLICLLAAHFISVGQIRWTGLGGDGRWANASNWSNNQLPATTSDVILDNDLRTGNYSVTLPNNATTVRSITITPAGANVIELILPATNTSSPALTLSSSGHSLTLHKGAIFRNSSGASTGDPLSPTGTIWIGNGAQYIHNTPRSHTVVVSKLSAAPGTETGIFEFDVKGGGPIISFAGRTFGSLVLSAKANGTTKAYNASGSTATLIRGDLVIHDGVSFNLDLKAAVTIKGNYRQYGGRFNLGSNANNTVVRLAGHFTQTKGDITTNTVGDQPVLELNGAATQQITAASTGITNTVTVKVNNPAGVVLHTALKLPYRLQLTAGRITTTAANLLTLQAGCSLQADTLTAGNFIDGPLKKEGLLSTGQFLFPVGKGNTQRWMTLMQATGNYTVEFHQSNPYAKSNKYLAPIHHISSIEHWSVTADALSTPQAAVKLSFNDPNSGGVTDLSALRIAQLLGGHWTDAGMAGYAGNAGSNGFVVSAPILNFGSAPQYFTLASTSRSFNPLVQSQRSIAVPPTAFTASGSMVPTITNGLTQLRIHASIRSTGQLQIVNHLGQVCQQMPLSLNKGNNNIPVNVSSLRAGLYFLQLAATKERIEPLRLVKL